MKLITDQMESEFTQAEQSDLPVAQARRLLEMGLAQQFRRLAEGLMASEILRVGDLPQDSWAQYASTTPMLSTGDGSDSLKRLRQEFAEKIGNGSIAPLPINAMAKVRIRIIRRYVPLWNDIEINRQLRQLASGKRLAVPGANALTAVALRDFAGLDPLDDQVDGRFILGSIGDCGMTQLGPLFEYRDELAVSPYLEPAAAGMSYGYGIIIRDTVLKANIAANAEGSAASGTTAPADDQATADQTLALLRLRTLVHELVHAASEERANSPRFAAGAAFVIESMRDDICRYALQPRSEKEIEDALHPYVTIPRMILERARKACGAEWRIVDISPGELVRELVEAERLVRLEDGRVSSKHQDDWPTWNL